MVGHACPGPLGGEGPGFRSNGTRNWVYLRYAAPSIGRAGFRYSATDRRLRVDRWPTDIAIIALPTPLRPRSAEDDFSISRPARDQIGAP